MKPRDLILRCFAEKKHDQWQAFCLDLSLAAQGDTFEQAKQKLEAMIVDYVQEALVGNDREYADQLLPRRAPLRDWLKYYYLALRCRVGSLREGVCRLFTEALPLGPSSHSHA